MKSAYIPALTGLRGMAAFWVFLYQLIWNQSIPVVRDGYLGVDVFFLLSGFVLSHVYYADFARISRHDYLRFLKLRLARIYPLHLFTTLVLGIAVAAFPSFVDRYDNHQEIFSATSFVANLVLVQRWIYWWPLTWNQPAWSLSAEWLAYLIFPLMTASIHRLRSPLLCVYFAGGALLLLATLSALEHGLDFHNLGGLLRMATEFTAGCLLYRFQRTGSRLPVLPCTMAAVALVGAALSFRVLLCLAPFGLALVVMLAAQPEGPVAFALSRRPIIFLGEISYSLYLFDWMMIQFSNALLAATAPTTDAMALAWKLATGALILSASVAGYYGIERPARAWGRRMALRQPTHTSLSRRPS